MTLGHRSSHGKWSLPSCFPAVPFALNGLGCTSTCIAFRFLIYVQLSMTSRTSNPSESAPPHFNDIDVNGFHNVNIAFCGCSKLLGTPRWRQLMRIGWFPSTTSYPETCATFRALQQCQLLTLHSKLSHSQFYSALSRLTDGTDLSTFPVWAHFMPFCDYC